MAKQGANPAAMGDYGQILTLMVAQDIGAEGENPLDKGSKSLSLGDIGVLPVVYLGLP